MTYLESARSNNVYASSDDEIPTQRHHHIKADKVESRKCLFEPLEITSSKVILVEWIDLDPRLGTPKRLALIEEVKNFRLGKTIEQNTKLNSRLT
ncbi:hypothetical protein CR513_61352, partial [Mucuna pruriens]